MGIDQSQTAARQVGYVTLPIGLLLIAAPAPVANLLGGSQHKAALRVIGMCDLALVPGLVFSDRKSLWMVARVALNLGIAGYCLGQIRRQRSGVLGAGSAASAMITASVADVRTLRTLTGQLRRGGPDA